MSALTQTPAWRRLADLYERRRHDTLVARFRDDPGRERRFRYRLDGLELDLSGQRLDAEVLHALLALARQRKLKTAIRALLTGERVNFTERRAALHAAARGTPAARVPDFHRRLRRERERTYAYAHAVRSGAVRGQTGRRFSDVVNLGIGGSEWGTRLVTHALESPTLRKGTPNGAPRVHFVSGLDPAELKRLLAVADPERTLFLVCSKSFTTAETLLNAAAARDWLTHRLGKPAFRRHFAGVSAEPGRMRAFGLAPARCFRIWPSIGGRYSLWSAMGLAAVLSCGPEAFERMLEGAQRMDRHFRNAPLVANLPVLLGLTDIWNIDFLGIASRVILPQDDRLRDLPAYLMQLEMESLGKTATRDGLQADYPTGQAVWGDLGYRARHSFLQFLHQGSGAFAADLAIVEGVGKERQAMNHRISALSRLFVGGRKNRDPHRRYPGNRPHSVLRLRRLTPRLLGMLLALYEHKVYVQSAIWDIDAFDQHAVDFDNARR